MQQVKRGRILFKAAVIAYSISSASILLLPFSGNDGEGLSAMGYIIGILFWAGLLAGVGCWSAAYMGCRQKKGMQTAINTEKTGMICFFQNRQAVIADIVLIVSVAAMIGSMVISFGMWLNLITMFLLLYSFHLHYLFNGRLYKFLFKKRRRRERKE